MSFLISDAYAQDASGQAGTLELILPLLLMFANLLADIALAWADPRIVYE